MAKFRTFIGKVENSVKDNNSSLARMCDDVDCRNFREARTKAIELFKKQISEQNSLIALVVCDDLALLIGSGLRPASVRNFGNGYSVDVTPSLARKANADQGQSISAQPMAT